MRRHEASLENYSGFWRSWSASKWRGYIGADACPYRGGGVSVTGGEQDFFVDTRAVIMNGS